MKETHADIGLSEAYAEGKLSEGATVLMAAFGMYRLGRRAAPPEKHKGNFVVEPAVPVATTFEARTVKS